ncbi:hypothetical protein ACFLU6_12640, partial [Acidobacteriota bacterium]
LMEMHRQTEISRILDAYLGPLNAHLRQRPVYFRDMVTKAGTIGFAKVDIAKYRLFIKWRVVCAPFESITGYRWLAFRKRIDE